MRDQETEELNYIMEKSTVIVQEFVRSAEKHLEIKGKEYGPLELSTLVNVIIYLTKKVVMCGEQDSERRRELICFIANKAVNEIEEAEQEMRNAH